MVKLDGQYLIYECYGTLTCVEFYCDLYVAELIFQCCIVELCVLWWLVAVQWWLFALPWWLVLLWFGHQW